MKNWHFSNSFFTAMPIFCINMLQKEEYRLPNLFTVSGYKIYFWSNENNEPIHVHVSKGQPTPNSTKTGLQAAVAAFWLITEAEFLKMN